MSARDAALARFTSPTKLYNAIDSSTASAPAVGAVRDAQAELDRAVLNAYGWSDIILDHDYYEVGSTTRWCVSESVRADLIRRLLCLNHKLAEQKSTKILKEC